MTETLKAKSLFEISTVCIIATIIGLAVFWILKRINQTKEQVESLSLTGENMNSLKHPIKIDVFDLMIVIGIILFFYANQVLSFRQGVESVLWVQVQFGVLPDLF